MGDFFQRLFEGRPGWMNALMVFCAYMALIYMPFDLFWKPVEEDVEVWFGIMLRGWAAKMTEPLHWAIYAAGGWGFYRMRSWMWPWAALYVAQIAVGMLVWSVVAERGWGIAAGLAAAVPFSILAAVLWRSRPLFGTRADGSQPGGPSDGSQ